MNKEELINYIRVLEVDNINRLSDAYKKLDKCNQKNYMASGLTITIQNVNTNSLNTLVIDEFMIADGFSDALIAELKKEVKRSYDLKKSYIRNIE